MKEKVKIIYDFFLENKKNLKLKMLTDLEISKNKEIKSPVLDRPGLALTGFFRKFQETNIQVLDQHEIVFINEQIENNNLANLEKLCQKNIPCFICLGKKKLADKFIDLCQTNQIPVMKTSLESVIFYMLLMEILDEVFAPVDYVHGTLIDVFGSGVLLMGKSGIGKSEIALDLVERGHRLVCDDLVEIAKRGDNYLVGKSQEGFNEFLEVRGLGIINVKKIFGVKAIRMQKRVELVIYLEAFEQGKSYERLGLDEKFEKIHGIDIPKIILPVYPGKNITMIVETIALNLHLKVYGYNSAVDFNDKLIKKMMSQKKGKRNDNLKRYLMFDHE